jgi:hypothetical protein
MVVGRGGESNFCEFDRGPGAPTGEGDERVNDCDGVRVGHTHNVFIVHVVGENTSIGMQYPSTAPRRLSSRRFCGSCGISDSRSP